MPRSKVTSAQKNTQMQISHRRIEKNHRIEKLKKNSEIFTWQR